MDPDRSERPQIDPACWASARTTERGHRYFREGRVLVVSEQAALAVAFVLGTLAEPYRVEIAFEHGEPFATCTCPYDEEPLCKHAVALLYSLSTAPGSAPPPEPAESAPRRRRLTQPPPDRDERIEAARAMALAERVARARDQDLRIVRRPRGGVHGEYLVSSAVAEGAWCVVVRDREFREASCSCPDFLANELGTCKHVARVKRLLARSQWGRPPAAAWVYVTPRDWGDARPQPLAEVRAFVSPTAPEALAKLVSRAVDAAGYLRAPASALGRIERAAGEAGVPLAVEPEVTRRIEAAREERAWRQKTRDLAPGSPFMDRIAALLSVPLHRYQREGVVAALESRRLLLADEMGLGKTIQAIAAALGFRELGFVRRVLVVCPASIKRQWQSEIESRSGETARVVDGGRSARAELYAGEPPLFTIVNYELVYRDLEALNALEADLLILDEAQRIKNWDTKTALAVAKLRSRATLVLTGTPLENRLEDLHALMRSIDPRALGPLWRLAPAHVDIDAEGQRTGYVALDAIRARLAGSFLRRERQEVLSELPEVTENHYFTGLTEAQRAASAPFERQAARLVALADRRPLDDEEVRILMQLLNALRIIANGLAQFDYADFEPLVAAREPVDPRLLARLESPKLDEWRRVAEELLEGSGRAIVFSQWERMLNLAELAIRDVLEERGEVALFYTGSVKPAARERTIARFHEDPAARLLFSTDAGGVGLNLQGAAATVVHLDTPWNPALLAQRVGRVHRIGQERGVRVLHFISEGSIEERVLALGRAKRALAETLLSTEAASLTLDTEARARFVEQARSLVTASSAGSAPGVAAAAAVDPGRAAPRAPVASPEPARAPRPVDEQAPPPAPGNEPNEPPLALTMDPVTGSVTLTAANAQELLSALQDLVSRDGTGAAAGASPGAAAPALRRVPLDADGQTARLEAAPRLAQLDLLAERGRDHLASGDLEAAARVFETVLARSEDHLEAWLGLGEVKREGRDPKRAVAAYERAAALGRAALQGFEGQLPWSAYGNRGFLKALHGLVLARDELGDERGASEAAAELLRYEPSNPLGVARYLSFGKEAEGRPRRRRRAKAR